MVDFAPAFRVCGSLLAPGGSRARLSILIYHRVLPSGHTLLSGEVDSAIFDWHLKCVAARFNVLPLSEAIQRLARGSLPSRALCITFDDGYADNAEVALPVLQRHGLRATFFVATGFLNGGWMFNDKIIEAVRNAPGPSLDLTAAGLGTFDVSNVRARKKTMVAVLSAIKYLPQKERAEKADQIGAITSSITPRGLMMSTEQVRQLHKAGMEIGGHTVTHPILARVEPAAARLEIASGKEQLESIIGEAVTLFAYPNGRPATDYTAEHVAMVKSLGFKAAVATAWGVATRDADPYQLPRFTPWDRTPARFAFRLLHNLTRTSPALV